MSTLLPEKRFIFCLVVTALFARAAAVADVLVTEATGISIDVSPADGRIALDLAGGIWLLPRQGGDAELLSATLDGAARPRWSPDGGRILYERRQPTGSSLWILDVDSRRAVAIGDPAFHNQHGDWHPDGDRIIYASDRHGSGLDLWETDLATGLSWRLSHGPGDELEPAWSASGRHLAYIARSEDGDNLVLRRHGEPDRRIVNSTTRLSSLAWRPDGSMLTFMREFPASGPTENADREMAMAILSDPVLVRPLVTDDKLHRVPISWSDRLRLYYVADGTIRTRHFEERHGRRLPFRAFLPENEGPPPRPARRRDLPPISPPSGRLVIRAANLFDGIWDGYRQQMDVIVEAGRIAAVEPTRAHPDDIVIDLGDVTVMPGLIDAWSATPADTTPATGARILAAGVTTIVAPLPAGDVDPGKWEQDASPGPRWLPAARLSDAVADDDEVGDRFFLLDLNTTNEPAESIQQVANLWLEAGIPVIGGNGVRSNLIFATDDFASRLPVARYRNQPSGRQAVTLLSGLADAGTPGMTAVLQSRQAALYPRVPRPVRRLSSLPNFATSSAPIIAASRPNGLPAGLALHAELSALVAAGVDNDSALHAAGRNAAVMLGLENQLGVIVPGALADLVLVRGDPLADIGSTLDIVAVVRNGRFYSLIALLERATAGDAVE